VEKSSTTRNFSFRGVFMTGPLMFDAKR